MNDITPAAAISRLHEIFDRTLVKRGPDTGKRSSLDVSSVLEVMPLLDALSTPPADDVRELVDRMRRASRAVYLATDATVADDISDMLTRAASALADVRPRGTVTDAEAERAEILADLREWSRPLRHSPEEDTLRLVIARIEARS